MTNDGEPPAAQQLGAYITVRREELGCSIRELARKAGIDAGGLARIEQGKRIHSPRPAILNKLASALEVPITELLARVGYDTPHNLHDFIQSSYGHLPEEAIVAATDYVERLASEYDIDPRGPIDQEDET